MLGVRRAWKKLGAEIGNIACENARLKEENESLRTENAKFRDALRACVVGTHAELCADADYSNCKECSMNRDRDNCAMTDAMKLLDCDVYDELMNRVSWRTS